MVPLRAAKVPGVGLHGSDGYRKRGPGRGRALRALRFTPGYSFQAELPDDPRRFALFAVCIGAVRRLVKQEIYAGGQAQGSYHEHSDAGDEMDAAF